MLVILREANGTTRTLDPSDNDKMCDADFNKVLDVIDVVAPLDPEWANDVWVCGADNTVHRATAAEVLLA